MNKDNNEMNTEQIINIPEYTPIAPHIRIAAFCLDAILAFALAMVLVMNFALPIFHPGGKEDIMESLSKYIQTVQETKKQEAGAKGEPVPAPEFTDEQKEVIGFINQFVFAIIWLYFALSEFFLNGSSLGKKVFSIQVINTNTLQNPTFLQSMVRSFIKTACLLYFFPFLLLNYLFAFFNKEKKAGHDFAVKTNVVSIR